MMKKPVVVWCTQIYLVWAALGAGLVVLASTVDLLNGRLSVEQAGGGLLLGGVGVTGATTLLVKASRRQISRHWIVLFLWFMFALYPTTFFLRQAGYYSPRVADNQPAGPALADILRYVMPMALIVWLSLSKRAAEYVSASAPGKI
jgi:hypothetical protein